MTRLRRIAVATASALPLVVVLSQALPEWRDDPAKVRECISLVNGLMPENLTIEPHELRQELVERGVTLPLPPSLAFTPRDSGREAEALLRQYESATKAYEAKWEDIKDSPEYQRAREAILNRKRDESLRGCLRLQEMQERLWPSR
jgi:hypothetical protein